MLTKRKNKAIRYMNIISKLVLALSYLKKKKIPTLFKCTAFTLTFLTN